MKNIKAQPLTGWPNTMTAKAETLNEYIVCAYIETWENTEEFISPENAAHSLVHYDDMFEAKFPTLFTQYEDRLDLEYGLEEHISTLIMGLLYKQLKSYT